MIKFYLNFITSGHGKIEIKEPVGLDQAEFGISQHDKGWGRDKVYAGMENKLSIYSFAEQRAFDLLMYNYTFYGYESVINFEIEFTDSEHEVGRVDWVTFETDKVNYISFSIIEGGNKTLLKNRADIKNNLLSSEDLDGNPITPCQTSKILMKAKPVTGISRWETPVELNVLGALYDSSFDITTNLGVNGAFAQVQYDLENTLSFSFRSTTLTNGIPNVDSFAYVEAKDNIENLKIDLTNIDVKANSSLSNNPLDPVITDANGYARLVVRWGDSLLTSSVHTLSIISFGFGDSGDIAFPTSLTYTIPFLKRNEKVWIYIENKVNVETSGPGDASTYAIGNKFAKMDVRIEGTSVAFNTVVDAVRLYDAMEYVVKSSSGLEIDAPRWDVTGEFYDQYITTTPLMRNLQDKPFNVEFKNITDDYLPEVSGDYEIKDDGKVFFGIYPDFYRPVQLGVFPMKQNDEYVRSNNKNYSLNKFTLEFSSYASKKENEQENTYDIVHGKNELLLPLNGVYASKEVKAGWIRDPFLIEQQRRKAYDLSDTSATQDDDKIYILDIVPLQNSDRTYTETTFLQHTYDDEANTLTITNDNTFSFALLGIAELSQIIINNTANAGSYNVTYVDDRKLVLLRTSSGTPVTIASENTTFTYTVSPLICNLTIRTNEGFSVIENIADGDNFANLRFTTTRCIKNYWGQYLAACNTYAANNPITSTYYVNNRDAITKYNGETESITEGENLYPDNAILTPEIDNVTLIMTLSQFFEIRSNIRAQRGYIKYYDSVGLPVNGYIQDGKFLVTGSNNEVSDLTGEFKCVMEIKYEPFLLDIFKTTDTGLIVNGVEYSSNFTHSIDEYNNLSIFDATGKHILVPVPYNRVRVNNSGQASSTTELAQWLTAIE